MTVVSYFLPHMKRLLVPLFLVLLCVPLMGFDLSNSSVPKKEIRAGGPPKDGIPALTDPKVIPKQKATYLNDADRVLGVVISEKARAYPLRILNWHEIVNDTLEEVPFVVTYCPLCGTGMVFEASNQEGGRDLFGVSGLLYNSDVLLYDKQTESLWSQIGMEAISGKRKGDELRILPATHTTWGDWSTKHPNTSVLSLETGYRRDYSKNPYAGYAKSHKLYFPVANKDNRFHPKDWVAGVIINGKPRAYPFNELKKLDASQGSFTDTIDGVPLTISYDLSHRTLTVKDASGSEIPNTQSYWFAWAAFHPETSIFEVSSLSQQGGEQ